MSQTIKAVYKHGAFHPLDPVTGLEENARVRVLVEPLEESVDAMMELAFATYEGLTEAQIEAIEASRLDQEGFFKRR